MQALWIIFVGSVGLISAGTGCAEKPVAVFNVPEQLTLYSIDGREIEARYQPMDGETFQGYPVLGKVEVTDAAERKELMASLEDGIAKSEEDVLDCFWPRHAMRTTEKGQAIDYVICFECLHLEVHVSGSQSMKRVTREPRKVFDRHLKAAQIPLAPLHPAMSEL